MTVRRSDLLAPDGSPLLLEPGVTLEPGPAVIDPLKPGWKTTEGWLAIACLVSGLVAAGYAASGRTDGEHATQLVKDAVIGLGGLVLAALPVWQYIRGRGEVKVAAVNASAAPTSMFALSPRGAA